MQTYPEMNRIIVGMIEDSEHLHVQYAAARIKELEQQLQAERQKRQDVHDAAEVAMAAASRCDVLNAELIEQRDAERRIAHQRIKELEQEVAASIEVANINAAYRESSTKYAQAARIARQQLHAECRIAEKAEAALAMATTRIEDLENSLAYCNVDCET